MSTGPTLDRQARPSRSGAAFTLVEVLIVVVVLGILAAIVVPQFAGASDSARNATAGEIVRTVQQQIALHRAKHGQFPNTIDPNWFTPPGLPQNPYLPEGVDLVVQNIAGKTELDYKHSNKGPIIWWYNRATGSFHTRVPWQGSNAASLDLYNEVNHCNAENY